MKIEKHRTVESDQFLLKPLQVKVTLSKPISNSIDSSEAAALRRDHVNIFGLGLDNRLFLVDRRLELFSNQYRSQMALHRG